MKIRIPNVDDKECYIEDKQSIVLLGANGAGKTRMSVWIDENNPELNISEISDRTGFSFPKYFSKCFKSHFGAPPSAYLHKK